MKNYYWTLVFGDEKVNVRLLKRPSLNIEEKYDEILDTWVPGAMHWEPLDLICEFGEGRKIINSAPLKLSLVLRLKNDSMPHPTYQQPDKGYTVSQLLCEELSDVVEQWDLEGVVTTENEIDHDIIQVNFKEVKYVHTSSFLRL